MMIDPIAKILGEWSYTDNFESIVLRLFLATIMAAVIGCERSGKRHSAGLRTFLLVSLSTTLAMMLDAFIPEYFYLLASASVVGVAIISVRSLLTSSRNQIKGLTTAVALFTCGMIGLAVGAAYYTAALIAFALLVIALTVLPSWERYLKNRSNHFEIHLEMKRAEDLPNFVSTLRRLGLVIDDIERNPAYLGSGLSVYSIALSVCSKELKKYKTHTEIIEALGSLPYICHIEEMSM